LGIHSVCHGKRIQGGTKSGQGRDILWADSSPCIGGLFFSHEAYRDAYVVFYPVGGFMFRIILGLMLAMLLWFQGIKPIVSDCYQIKRNLDKALAWNPNDSMLQLRSGNIMRAIETNNGDITQYSLWCSLAARLLRQENRNLTMYAINRSLYYYPNYEPAKRLMAELNK